ncbi:MAG: Fatty acid desaturase [Elusimicrobia bacterium]|nr:MAG: Fatty acid desaturase [Elusimicrobiota bacterium]
MPETKDYPIPGALNLAIAAAQLCVLVGTLAAAARADSWWGVAGLAVVYGLVMNSAYAMLHEGEHGTLHTHRLVNDGVATVLALFFPAPFHLIRQGHLGHHMRNRSDDEAFDYYFQGENAVWKYLQLYGTLTGAFWLVIALSNFLAVLRPSLVRVRYATWDRPTAALLESLNPKYHRLIQAEAAAALLLHAGLMWAFDVPFARYAAVLFGFGFMWSALQYAHHYDTTRDVLWGAKNIRTWAWLDWLLLNHNWHLNHHLEPTVPWIHLRTLRSDTKTEPGGLVRAYIEMWKGPRFTENRVKNRYAGVLVR